PVEPSVPAAIRRHYGQPPEGRQATRRGAGRAVSRPEGARSRAGVRRSATCTLGRSAAATAAPSTRKRRILSGCGASSTAMEDPHGKRTILAPRVPAKLTSPTRAFTPSDRRRRPPETGTTRAVVPAPDGVTPVRRPPRSLRDRVRHRPRLHDRTDHHPAVTVGPPWVRRRPGSLLSAGLLALGLGVPGRSTRLRGVVGLD